MDKSALENLNTEQWESLCDGCARCCLHKLIDEDSGQLYFTSVACRYLDLDTCRCKDYQHRFANVPECMNVKDQLTQCLEYLPESCAYKRRYQGLPLAQWHHLVCGDDDQVHQSGVSVRSYAISEEQLPSDSNYQDFIILLE